MSNPTNTNVHVSFMLNIDLAEWVGRHKGIPADIDFSDDSGVDRLAATVAREVQAHAENVIRDLYTDMGWLTETVNQ